MRTDLRWEWLIEWNAWWLIRSTGMTMERVYGPFRSDEVRLAADIHGVPVPHAA